MNSTVFVFPAPIFFITCWFVVPNVENGSSLYVMLVAVCSTAIKLRLILISLSNESAMFSSSMFKTVFFPGGIGSGA